MTPRFWHAHLNHACTRAVSPLGGAGTSDNMAGDQLAIWNQVNMHNNEPIPSTHLTIYVPPALGAFILANLKAPKGDPPQLRPVIPSQPHLSSVLTASQLFNLNLPLIFPENEDIIMDNARQAAAAGFVRSESIPLLALTDESFYHRKLDWTLRFPVPPPDTSGSARRFSSTVTFRQGPHSAEALEGALRLAASFSYNNDASHVLFNSPFLRLPDLSVLRPPRIDPLEDPSPPEHAVREWLNNRAPRLIPTRYRQYHPVPLGLVDFFNSNIDLVQVATLIETHQCNDEDATAEARKHKRDHVPHAFLKVTPTGTVMPGSRLPDLPSASPTPETLPHTALAPPPSVPAPRPAPPPAQSSHSSQSASTRPQRPPPFSPSSDSKRPRIPGKGTSLTSHSGYMSHFTDNTRPVGYAVPPAERTGRGPYHKGKGADKGTFKGKDKFPSDWPPLSPVPPKGFCDQPVAYCPARPPELIHLLTTHLFPHSPTRTFVLQLHFHPTSPFALFHIPSPGLSTGTFYPSFCTLIHSLFIQIHLMRSSCLPLRTKPLRLLLPSSLLFTIINSQPCYNQSPPLPTPIGPPFRRRLLRIVLRFFG